jgi:hypothetical protein
MIHTLIRLILPGFLLLNSAIALGQSTTLPELLAAKDQWPTYAVDGKKFQFEGRFEGRSGNTIRIIKFDVSCNLPSNGTFPDNIRSGQRIDIIGRFLSENSKLSFVVSRILIKDTDMGKIRSRAKDIPADQPTKLLSLADEYQSDANFYEDTALKAEIAALRTDGVLQLRKSARGDVAKLRELLKQSQSLGIRSDVMQLLQFEIIYAASKIKNADVEALVAETKMSCEGWDQLVPPVPERLRLAFPKQAVETFSEAQKNDRRALNRLLYQSLRLRQIQSMIKPDGSNGLEISKLIRSEFGDHDPLAAQFEERYVTYRLTPIATLSRTGLQGLTEELTTLKRSQQVPSAVRDWLLAQERKIGTSNLAGLLRTADEYLFAADLLQSPDYGRQGVELLKKAWISASESSPTDAEQIADRLNRLGWERLDNKWMTNDQMKALPKNDVQLAIREGRVVPGMNAQQVVQTLGQPTKISRLGSRKSVCELWSYEGEHSAGMVIRFRRNSDDKATASIVEDVSRIQASRR